MKNEILKNILCKLNKSLIFKDGGIHSYISCILSLTDELSEEYTLALSGKSSVPDLNTFLSSYVEVWLPKHIGARTIKVPVKFIYEVNDFNSKYITILQLIDTENYELTADIIDLINFIFHEQSILSAIISKKNHVSQILMKFKNVDNSLKMIRQSILDDIPNLERPQEFFGYFGHGFGSLLDFFNDFAIILAIPHSKFRPLNTNWQTPANVNTTNLFIVHKLIEHVRNILSEVELYFGGEISFETLADMTDKFIMVTNWNYFYSIGELVDDGFVCKKGRVLLTKRLVDVYKQTLTDGIKRIETKYIDIME